MRSWQPALDERVDAGRTLVIEFWRCEMDQSIEIRASEEGFDEIVRAIEATGIKIEKREIPAASVYATSDAGRHKLRACLRAVHEVQGLKLQEGIDVLPAIESLVTEYAKLK